MSLYTLENENGVTLKDVMHQVKLHNDNWEDVDLRTKYDTQSEQSLLGELCGDTDAINGEFTNISIEWSDTFRGKIKIIRKQLEMATLLPFTS